MITAATVPDVFGRALLNACVALLLVAAVVSLAIGVFAVGRGIRAWWRDRQFVQAYVPRFEDTTGLPDPEPYDEHADSAAAEDLMFERWAAEMSADAHKDARKIKERYLDDIARRGGWFR